MSNYNEYVIERVMQHMLSAVSRHMETRDKETGHFLDSYRIMAIAALDAIDSLYESEADESVEVVS